MLRASLGTAILAYVFWVLPITATPHLSHNHVLEARANTIAITGVTDSGVQPRLEIRQLASDPVAWNLFLLALIQFQAQPQNSPTSYYQIAGIHGVPYIPWDGVTGSGSVGYCTHASTLFGPWHRPYLALMEQQIHNIAVDIANQFPSGNARTTNQAAAAKCRIPYWDWAMVPPSGGSVLPTQLSQSTVTITNPNGQTSTVANPLYSYQFHPLTPSDMVYSPYNKYPGTVRWPSSSSASATSNQNSVNSQMTSSLSNFRSQLMTLFSNYQSYNGFSSAASNSRIGNIESVHNTIHVLLGGNGQYGGHMSSVPVSAFDPVFWLHHANVDRITAIWQTLYPNTYLDPARQNGNTYTLKSGTTTNLDTPLYPFHSDTKGTYWTPRSAQSTKTFGYTYPELANNPLNATLIASINSLYGTTTSRSGGRSKRDLYIPSSISQALSSGNGSLISSLLGQAQAPREWLTAVTMPLNYGDTGYSVFVFLGEVTSPPDDYANDPNFVGSQAVLAMPGMADTAGGATTLANIHLTDALGAAHDTGDLPATDELAVLAYLSRNIRWRVVVAGNVVPPSQVPGLAFLCRSVSVQINPGLTRFDRWLGAARDYPFVRSRD